MSGEQIRLQVPPKLFGVNSWLFVKPMHFAFYNHCNASSPTCILDGGDVTKVFSGSTIRWFQCLIGFCANLFAWRAWQDETICSYFKATSKKN